MPIAEAARLKLAPPSLSADSIALFLDLDGVLAAIASTPEGVVEDPDRTAMLRRLQDRLQGRLAVISGREIAEIDRICGGAVKVAAGIHGLERRHADGRMQRVEPSAGVARALEDMRVFAEAWPGVLIEDKGLAAGLHYRQAPEAEQAARELSEALAARHDLIVQPGHMIHELKTPGADKGRALAAFMEEAPFKGFTPVMLGDDLTDEFGFEAAARLGGGGVLVGPERQTHARWGLADQPTAMAWLEALSRTPRQETSR